MKHFPSLIRILFLKVTSKAIKKRLMEVHLQSICLCTILSYTVRITDFNARKLIFMKKTAKNLFKMCCVFDSKISPRLWAVCNASRVHAEISLKSYVFGIGCNTIGREQTSNYCKVF